MGRAKLVDGLGEELRLFRVEVPDLMQKGSLWEPVFIPTKQKGKNLYKV